MKLYEIFEGKVKNAAIDREYAMSKQKKAPAPVAKGPSIMVNGRPWKKDGVLVTFPDDDAALRAVRTIMRKYGKTAQVVPVSGINEAALETIEDDLYRRFVKPPLFDYVRKHGPERTLDAIEKISALHKGLPAEPIDIEPLIQQVIDVLVTTDRRPK